MKTWKKWAVVASAFGVVCWIMVNVAWCTHGVVAANFWAGSGLAAILAITFGFYAGHLHPD